VGCAQPAAHLQAVDARQHPVEHDRVVVELGGVPHGVRAGGRDLDGVAVLLQPAPDQVRHARLVLHHQHPHGKQRYAGHM